ncbi:hypothetical protein AVEN_147405-1 [Araneus ventricosus]|uniref:Uncharacterized protein n=1 Tax=Araneus ventricosus TaxID=182803 RepID=A0A4Y2DQH1_ARAVE|nr:hypothetical protein AVEN_147405-1 [Araneus ventricosus]
MIRSHLSGLKPYPTRESPCMLSWCTLNLSCRSNVLQKWCGSLRIRVTGTDRIYEDGSKILFEENLDQNKCLELRLGAKSGLYDDGWLQTFPRELLQQFLNF